MPVDLFPPINIPVVVVVAAFYSGIQTFDRKLRRVSEFPRNNPCYRIFTID
jgi:hypothetical protein